MFNKLPLLFEYATNGLFVKGRGVPSDKFPKLTQRALITLP